MARTVQEKPLSTPTARLRLRSGRQPHWRLISKRVCVGYQRHKGQREGRWLIRRHLGPNKYSITPLGRADDAVAADGDDVLSFEQAEVKARALVNAQPSKVANLTVRAALERYIDYKRSKDKSVSGDISRGAAHITPVLGDLAVSELTTEILRNWLTNLANMPAQTRPQNRNKPQYRPMAKTEEQKRQRKNSANRVLNILRAALNFAHKEGHVPSADAWGKRLEPFKGVSAARLRYLIEGGSGPIDQCF